MLSDRTTTAQALSSGRLVSLVSLPLLAMVVFASLFYMSTSAWVRFGQENGIPAGLFTQSDFAAVAIASKLVHDGYGAELYDLNRQLQGQQQMRSHGFLSLSPNENQELKYPYPYAPFIALLWSPLADLSPFVGIALWNLLNLVAMAIGLWYLLRSLPIPNLTRTLLLIAAATSFPFINDLEQGQSSGIVLFALAMGLALLRRKHDLPAGLAFGLLVLKIQWLPLLVIVLLWKRRWRSLAGLMGVSFALSLAAVVTMGTAWIPDYISIVLRAQHWARELALDPWYSHSLSGGLTALLGRGTDDLVGHLMTVATLAGAALLLFVWRGKWRPGSARWDGAMSLTMVVVIFTNLQVNTHDLCMLVLPAALGISYLYQQPRGEAVKASLVRSCSGRAISYLPLF